MQGEEETEEFKWTKERRQERGDRENQKRRDGSLPLLPLGVDPVAAGHVDTES